MLLLDGFTMLWRPTTGERLMKVLTCQRSQHVNIDTLAEDDIVALAEYLSTQGSYNLDVIRI